MRSNGTLIAFAISAANMSLLALWRILIHARPSDLYFVPKLTVHDLVGVLITELLLAAFIFLACLVSSAALGLPLWQRDGADSLLVAWSGSGTW